MLLEVMPGSFAPKYGRPNPMHDTVVLVRAHSHDKALTEVLHSLSGQHGYDVAIVLDETAGSQDHPGQVPVLSLTAKTVQAIGLPTPNRLGWVCGDYGFYLALAAFPAARHFWLLETDLMINFERPADFFNFFRSVPDVDLLAARLQQRGAGWMWHDPIAKDGRPVWGCLFSLVRLSRPAVEACLAARVATNGTWSHAAPVGSFPNDESFVCTTLQETGFICRDLNDIGQSFYTSKTLTFQAPFSRRRLCANPPDGMVYHRVLEGEAFRGRYQAWLQGQFGKVAAEDAAETLPDAMHEFDSAGFARVVTAVEGMQRDAEFDRHWDALPQCHTGALSRVIHPARPCFHARHEGDYISGYHQRGEFYEQYLLELLQYQVKAGFTFLDVGAHVGNHSVYAGLVLKAGRIIPVEPGHEQWQQLVTNLKLNGLRDITDLRHGRLALGDVEGQACLGRPDINNSGRDRVVAGAQADTPVWTGDRLLGKDRIDCIKLDIGEGAIGVLEGLDCSIRRWHPVMMLSVVESEHEALARLVARHGYTRLITRQQYPVQQVWIIA